MSMTKVNNWYFGDYLGSYQGYFYNNLIYSVTIFLFLTIALETEQSLVEKYNLDVLINFVYELVQAFFLKFGFENIFIVFISVCLAFLISTKHV